MSHCINTSHPEYQELLLQSNLMPAILKAKIATWMDNNTADRFPSIVELLNIGEVNQTLRVVDALSKIQRGLFTQDKLQGWLNDLQKQGVSNDQLEIFKEIAKPGMSKEEIATSIAATYSYTVEINTAKTNINSGGAAVQELDDLYIPSLRETFYFSYRDGWFKEDKNQDRIIATPEELKIIEEYKNKDAKQNSSFYSNLTVPGGTNYTEQEIATPDITPSIKGHAQFATDKGIGWFRSDEAVIGQVTIKTGEFEGEDIYTTYEEGTPTKTRRILEVQSDLFQKGRDKENLVTGNIQSFQEKEFNSLNKVFDEVLNFFHFCRL